MFFIFCLYFSFVLAISVILGFQDSEGVFVAENRARSSVYFPTMGCSEYLSLMLMSSFPEIFKSKRPFSPPQNPLLQIPHSNHHRNKSSEGADNIFRLGLAADVGLAGRKALTDYLSGSTAIIVDAAHSTSNVVTRCSFNHLSILTLFSVFFF